MKTLCHIFLAGFLEGRTPDHRGRTLAMLLQQTDRKAEATHFGGDDWEIETKDESVFYVAVGYENCIFRFVANLSHFIPDLNDAGDEWGSPSKIGTLIESEGDVFLKHHVLLPFGSEKTLSYNIKMFDYLATKAIDSAKEVKAEPLGKSL